ncbi:MAG: c-type cytochrome domain-containing protein [Mariniphaga sp.]
MQGRKTLRISLKLLFALTFLALIYIQCRHDGLNVSTLKPVCFDTEISPIFLNKCATCHGQNRSKGGVAFYDYNSIFASVKPYDAQNSKAYKAITGKGFTQLMPPKGALSENERILIRVWIDQGAKNTLCTITPTPVVPVDTTHTGGSTAGAVCFQRDILPILTSSCGTSGCHDAQTHREGYTIIDYASVMTNLVKAGSPNSSRLYTAVANNNMPPNSYTKLTQAKKDSIYNWIKNGALNSTCTSTCDTTGVMTYQNQISAILSNNCVSCHSGANAQKGVLLDNYASVKANMDNGSILSAVKGITLQMPPTPASKISSCQIRQLELWKSSGELQN